MIHIIDGQSDEIVGIIPMGEFWGDNYHRSLKTTMETFRFLTFSDKDYSEYLTGRNKLIITDESGLYRELIIRRAEKTHSIGKDLFAFADGSYNTLKTVTIIKPQTIEGKRASEVAGIILDDTEWRVGLVESEGKRTFHIEKHTNPYAMLKRIATEFDLELDFRIEISGNKITGRYVDLVQQVGQWRGREIEFSKDLLSIRRIEDTDNTYTALIGLGPEKEDGTKLEVLVEDEEALQRWGRPDPITGELRHIIGTYEPQSSDQNMTYNRLKELVENELEKRVKALVQYETTFADLEHVPGMEDEIVRLGDTLRTKDTEFNPPLYLEARVFEVDGPISDRSKKQAKLGDYTEYTEDQVNAIWQSLQDEIRRSIARMLSVNVVSSAGTVFKNGIGNTELTAVVYNQGNETDESGETYEYTWTRYDKHGNLDADWSSSGKKITVQGGDIDEKAMYACEVVFQDVAVLGYVTLTNVFDGTQGIPGKPGEDGRTSYFHTAYANSADGNLDFSLTDFDGKLYIGTYTDFEPNDSTDPSDYKWARFKGEQGPRGLQGLQGPEGDRGIPGEPGEDGKSSYTHIAYADDKQGGGFSQDPTGKEYMGVYVDHQPQDSDNPNDYKWSLIKGQDGEDGIPGKPGEDGRTPYLHIAYADDAQGGGFSQSPDGKEYIGTYTDFTQADSDNPNDYTWQRTKGDKGDRGPQGVPGPKGEDGQTLYTWVKYADTPTSGMSDNPNGKEYIGLAYNKTSPNESSNYNDYQWTKAKGDKGAPGPKGDNGQTTYTWVKYADDKDGNGMSDDSEGKRYLGLAYNKTTPNESSNPSDYNWSPLYDNVKPGVRNYALDTKEEVTIHTWIASYTLSQDKNTLANSPAIVSFEAKHEEGREPAEPHVYYRADDGSNLGHSFGERKQTTTEYQKFVIPIDKDKIPADMTEYVTITVRVISTGEPVYLRNFKLEKGNIATDWTPAPEDERAYAEYISQLKADLAEEEAKAHADGKVTEEEKARINDVRDKLKQAKQHANDVSKQAEDNAKGHADKVSKDKADQALRDAKAFSENASNIKEGIINVNSVPIRSSASGATIGWDELNGIWQKNNKGEYTFQSDMQGNNRMVNAYVSGEIHAQTGTFAGELRGASGTFGHVTVKNGDFILEDDVTSAPYSATPKRNLIKDHSFELIPQDADAANQDSVDHNWLPIRPNNGNYEDTSWERRGNPMVAIQFAPSSYKALAMIGEKAIVVRNAHYVRQFVYEGVGAGSVYTVSAYFKRQWQLASGIPRIEIWHVNAAGNRSSKIVNSTFARVNNDYSESKHATTFTVPSNFETGDSLEVIISGGDDNWVQCDGVQMVEGEIASVYLPEDMIWDMAKGNITKKNQMLSLWVGEAYPTGSQKIYPQKKLQDCANGWILVWSRYNKGEGLANIQFYHTYIPKKAENGSYSFEIPQSAATTLFKYLFINNESIAGHDQNNQDANHRAALREVLEW